MRLWQHGETPLVCDKGRRGEEYGTERLAEPAPPLRLRGETLAQLNLQTCRRRPAFSPGSFRTCDQMPGDRKLYLVRTPQGGTHNSAELLAAVAKVAERIPPFPRIVHFTRPG